MKAVAAFAVALIVSACAWPHTVSRSAVVRAEFQRSNPCPATSNSRGPCRGYEIDHITPLKCGGADAPLNMQWLTVEQHKIKTAREAKDCHRRR